MPSHEEIQTDLPAYAGGRLDVAARRRVESHLDGCEVCSEMAGLLQEIVSALETGGEAMFDPHPEPAALRDVALDGGSSAGPAVAQHVASCASCELEVAIWKGRHEAAGTARAPSSARTFRAPRSLVPSATLAAGVVIGLGLAILLRSGPPPAGEPAAPPAPPAPAARAWSGPARLVVLPAPVRGDAPRVHATKDASAPYVPIAVRIDPPASAGEEDLLRFEIRRDGGEAVWSCEMTVAEVRRHLLASEVVTLLVSAESLPPGPYELRLSSASEPDPPILRRVPFEIAP